MKMIKKLVIATGLILHFAGSIYASSYNMNNWTNALLAFGGGSNPAAAAQNVISSQGKATFNSAYTTAQKIGTPEAWAVGAWMASKNQSQFKSKYKNNDVQAAANALAGSATAPSSPTMAGPTPSASAANSAASSAAAAAQQQQTAIANALQQQQQQFQQQQQAAIADALQQQQKQFQQQQQVAITNALQQQQQADVAAATANNQALSAVASGKQQGADLYNAYADYIFNLLGQAVAGISDAPTQQAVIQHIQSNAASLSASSAGSSSYNSRTLGRMNSKKSSKKNKHCRSYAK